MNFFKKKNDINLKEMQDNPISVRVSEENIGVIYGKTPMYIPLNTIICATFENDNEELKYVNGRVSEIYMVPFTQVKGEYMEIKVDTSRNYAGSYVYIRIFENCATWLDGEEYADKQAMARPPRKEHRKRCTTLCINTVRMKFDNDNRVKLKIIKWYEVKGKFCFVQGSRIQVWYSYQSTTCDTVGSVIEIDNDNLILDKSSTYYYTTHSIPLSDILSVELIITNEPENKAVILKDTEYRVTNSPFEELYTMLK